MRMRLCRKRDRRARIVVKILFTVLVWIILSGYIEISIVQKYTAGLDQKAIITLTLLFFVAISLWGLFNRTFHGYFLSAVLMIGSIIGLSWLSQKAMERFPDLFTGLQAENRNLLIVIALTVLFGALDVRNYIMTRNGSPYDGYGNFSKKNRRRRDW